MENLNIEDFVRQNDEQRAVRLLEIVEEIKDEKAFDFLWTPKGLRYFVKSMWPEALDRICEIGKDRDKSVLESALAKAVELLYVEEIVVLIKHGARLTDPKYSKRWVLDTLFCVVYNRTWYRDRQLAILKAFVTSASGRDSEGDSDSYIPLLYEYVHLINVEDRDLVCYLVDIGINIYALDRNECMLYQRCEVWVGIPFARQLKVRQQFVNPLFTTMIWRLDLAAIPATLDVTSAVGPIHGADKLFKPHRIK